MPDPSPNDQPILTRPTPEVLDALFYELKDGPDADGLALAPGTPHPNVRQYPGFLFCKEERLSYGRVKRWWTTGDYKNQDTYNYGIEYAEESEEFPIFIRRYLVRRDQYDKATALLPFTGVYGIKLTNHGSGYTEPPTITLPGGDGSGAAARAIINTAGEVEWIFLTVEGAGYIAGPPNVVFTGGGGSGVTATAKIQPAGAILIKEKTSELPEDDPRRSLFILVTRIWETLPGPLLAGQTYNPRYDIAIGYTEQKVRADAANLGNPHAEITPIDALTSMERITTVPSNFFGTIFWAYPGHANLDLPDELTGVLVTYNSGLGHGTHSENGQTDATGTFDSVSLSLNLSSRSQGSSSVMPDVQPIIKETPARNVPTLQFDFFVAGEIVTVADILARLAVAPPFGAGLPVLAWPVFRPESVIFTAKGQQVSVTANASAQQHVNIQPSGFTRTKATGKGTSKETGLSVKTIAIRPTLHAGLNLSQASGDVVVGIGTVPLTATASARAKITAWAALPLVWPELDSTLQSSSGLATGSVTPTTVPATVPEAVPTTGFYLLDAVVRTADYGYSFVHAEVVDFSIFA